LPGVFKGLFFVWFLGTIAAVIALIIVSVHLNTVQQELSNNSAAIHGKLGYVASILIEGN